MRGTTLLAIAALANGAATDPVARSGRGADDAARAAILAADVAHARATERDGLVEGFSRALAEDVIYLHDGEPIVRGRAAVRALLARTSAAGATTPTWTPAFADVSADGTLGYSFGFTQASVRHADGTVQVAHGKYLTVWRAQGDTWRVAAYVRHTSPALPPPPPEGFDAPRARGAAPSQRGDPVVHAAAVRGADSAFAALSASTDAANAFGSFAAVDGVLLGGGQPMYGRDAIRAAFSQRAPGVTFVLRWWPTDAEAAPSGDLGFTVGEAISETGRPDGTTRKGYTKYVTVWRKERSGEWRFVVDCGNSRPGPP